MPLKFVEAETAYVIDGCEINHAYKDGDFDHRLDYWFEYEGDEFDIRDLDDTDCEDEEEILTRAIRSRAAPFDNLPPPQVFTVRRLVDAYQEYFVEVVASSPEHARELSEGMEFERGDVIEFDDTNIQVLDQNDHTVLEGHL